VKKCAVAKGLKGSADDLKGYSLKSLKLYEYVHVWFQRMCFLSHLGQTEIGPYRLLTFGPKVVCILLCYLSVLKGGKFLPF